EIVTDHGIWELGRFSVAYRRLFGESPSCTLRRGQGQPEVHLHRPSSLSLLAACTRRPGAFRTPKRAAPLTAHYPGVAAVIEKSPGRSGCRDGKCAGVCDRSVTPRAKNPCFGKNLRISPSVLLPCRRVRPPL